MLTFSHQVALQLIVEVVVQFGPLVWLPEAITKPLVISDRVWRRRGLLAATFLLARLVRGRLAHTDGRQRVLPAQLHGLVLLGVGLGLLVAVVHAEAVISDEGLPDKRKKVKSILK